MSQAIPSKLTWEHDGTPVKVTLVLDPQLASARGPRTVAFGLSVVCDGPQDFTLQFRLPWWLSGEPVVTVNGERQQVSASPSSLIRLRRKWEDETVHIALPKRLTSCPLPDAPAAVAFMDGPEVLAGLCDEEITLYGDKEHPETMLTPDNEREWAQWLTGYRTQNQPHSVRFVPLHQVRDQRRTVCFGIKDEP